MKAAFRFVAVTSVILGLAACHAASPPPPPPPAPPPAEAPAPPPPPPPAAVVVPPHRAPHRVVVAHRCRAGSHWVAIHRTAKGVLIHGHCAPNH